MKNTNDSFFKAKRLVFMAGGETPEPVEAPAPKAEVKESAQEFADRWGKMQKEGEKELEAALKEAQADKAAGKTPKGPQGQAVIGQMSYTDGSGTEKASPTPPKSGEEAEKAISGTEAKEGIPAAERGEFANKSGGEVNGRVASATTTAILRHLNSDAGKPDLLAMHGGESLEINVPVKGHGLHKFDVKKNPATGKVDMTLKAVA